LVGGGGWFSIKCVQLAWLEPESSDFKWVVLGWHGLELWVAAPPRLDFQALALWFVCRPI